MSNGACRNLSGGCFIECRNQPKIRGAEQNLGKFFLRGHRRHRSGGDDYSELVKRVMQHKPDFMVNTGDMVPSPSKSRWNDFWEKSKPVTVPYFLTVGNHDVNDKKSEELYKEVDLPDNKLYTFPMRIEG